MLLSMMAASPNEASIVAQSARASSRYFPFWSRCTHAARRTVQQTMQQNIEMLLDIGRRVQLTDTAEVERVTPDREHHQRREHQPGSVLGIDLAQLTVVDATLQSLAHQLMASRDHFLDIEAADLGKVTALRDHQLGDAGIRR